MIFNEVSSGFVVVLFGWNLMLNRGQGRPRLAHENVIAPLPRSDLSSM